MQRSFFACGLAALAAATAAPAFSASFSSRSVEPERRTPSVVVMNAPRNATLPEFAAPNETLRRLSPSVLVLGPVDDRTGRARVVAPANSAASAAACDEVRSQTARVDTEMPAPLASTEVPQIIRGGIVGNAFPEPATAAVAPREEVRVDNQPQVGNDGQPAAEVSPGSESAPSGGSHGPAPRLSVNR